MVGQDDMSNAIALNSAIFNLARIAGPAVAGIVISLVGTPTAFLLNAASYGAVITGLLLMRTADLNPAKRMARHKGQLREALTYLKGRAADLAAADDAVLRGHVRHELPGHHGPDVPEEPFTPGRARSAWPRPRSRPGPWAGR